MLRRGPSFRPFMHRAAFFGAKVSRAGRFLPFEVKRWMSALACWLPIKERNDLGAVFDLTATTVCYQELDQRVHSGKVGGVVNLSLMARGSKDASAFQDGKVAGQR